MTADELENKVISKATPGEALSSISFLIYNYDGDKLERCLNEIFNQNYINNFEVVICDDTSSDGAWDISCKYVGF